MIKSILVCLDGSEHGDAACAMALHLTARLQARLLGLHVLDSRMLEGPLMADLSGWIGAQPYGAQLQQFRELMEQKGQAVVRAFDDRCSKAGIQAESWLKMGHPARVILEEEARAELVVMGQRGEHAEWMGGLMGSTVERVVRHSVKPCLIVPDDGVLAVRPVVDWQRADRAAAANVSPSVLGVTQSAVDKLAACPDPAGQDAAERLRERLQAIRIEAYGLIDDVDPQHELGRRLELRADALRLCLDATSALVVAGAGRSMLRSDHAQLLARWAMFLTVQAQTAELRTALLRRLVG